MSEKQLSAIAVEIAARLRAARAHSDMTAESAADLAGIHAVSLSRYERGKQSPSTEILYKLAAVYRVQPHDLLPPIPGATGK